MCVVNKGIAVLADVKKKHSAHALTADVDIVETVRAADFFRADGVVVPGSSTGHPADSLELRKIKAATGDRVPVVIGSGITPENAIDFACADAFIVGSYFKEKGDWRNDLSPDRIAEMCKAMQTLCEC